MRLKDRAAFITGGATGLGKAYGLRLADEGADICIADIDEEGAKKTASLIRQKGRKALAVKMDVSSEQDAINGAKAAFEHFHRIDILINNAGLVRYVRRIPIEEIKLEEWNKVIAVNLTGMFLVSRAVIPYMKRSGKGKIINISSGVALHGGSLRHDYITSKAGVIGLTRALAVDLGQHNINVNAITPSGVEMSAARGEPPDPASDYMVRGRYIQRHLYPKDLEGVVAFLASDESDMITGQVINVDGGRVFVG